MKSIGFKLWAGIIMLVLVVIILLWFFQIVFLESFYYDMRISSIKDKGINILKFLANDDKRNFENQAEEFAFNNNLSIELIGLDKNTIYESTVASNAQNHMMRNYARNDAFNDVINGQEVTIPMEHPRFGNRFMLLGIPYEKNGKIIGAFFMNVPLAPVEDTVMILKKQLLYITIILLIASIIISSIMAKIFTRPILEIKRVSEKIAAGDFSDRIKNKSSDEIGSLADTINLMGKELSKIDQLRKDLIANVSHELRTPLSIIRGYAETIKDVTGDIKIKRDKQLDIIIEEAERLSKIVDDMLNLSQIQSGYLKIKQQKFLINKTIERVVKRYDIS